VLWVHLQPSLSDSRTSPSCAVVILSRDAVRPATAGTPGESVVNQTADFPPASGEGVPDHVTPLAPKAGELELVLIGVGRAEQHQGQALPGLSYASSPWLAYQRWNTT